MKAAIPTHAITTRDGDLLYLVRLRRDTYEPVAAADGKGNKIDLELGQTIKIPDRLAISIAVDVYGEGIA